MRVVKFGGTSVATAETRALCAKRVQSLRGLGPVVVVVSALDGVTEQLDELATTAARGDQAGAHALLGALTERHRHSRPQVLAELEEVVRALLSLRELTPSGKDRLLAFGEMLAAPIFADALGPDAVALTGAEAGVVTDDRFGEATPLAELSAYEIRQRLLPLLEAGKVPVVTGFIGATQHGVTTTLGRGGSDFTATLLAGALGASEVYLCSDTDGLKEADPRLVAGAETVESLSYAEAREMVGFGAKGIHRRAIDPAEAGKLTVRVVNTFDPSRPGTCIRGAPGGGRALRAVLLVPALAQLSAVVPPSGPRHGVLARALDALTRVGVSPRQLTHVGLETRLRFLVSAQELALARTTLEGTLVRTGLLAEVTAVERLAQVVLIGRGVEGDGAAEVTATALEALRAVGVSPSAVLQGASDLALALLMRADQAPEAVRAIHRAFFGAAARAVAR